MMFDPLPDGSLDQIKKIFEYRKRAIITRSLYTFYPIFEGQKL